MIAKNEGADNHQNVHKRIRILPLTMVAQIAYEHDIATHIYDDNDGIDATCPMLAPIIIMVTMRMSVMKTKAGPASWERKTYGVHVYRPICFGDCFINLFFFLGDSCFKTLFVLFLFC